MREVAEEGHAATLVWVAATVVGVEPTILLTQTDLHALPAVIADCAPSADPIRDAAATLVSICRRRPFPRFNDAIAWLAAVEVVTRTGDRVRAPEHRVIDLCRSVRSGALGVDDVARELEAWRETVGLRCPACRRRVYAGREGVMGHPSLSSGYELTARCSFEHGAHDRHGRPNPPPQRTRTPRSTPVVATGACGSMLVVDDDGALIVSPSCDDPPLFRVVVPDSVGAGDLVGRWDRLVARSRTLGFVDSRAVTLDPHGHLDSSALRAAARLDAPALVDAP